MEQDTKQTGLRVYCIVTGRPGYYNAITLAERLKQYETIDNVKKHYICREALTLLKEGATIQDIRKTIPCNEHVVLVDIDETVIDNILERKRKSSSAAKINAPDENGSYWWQKDENKVKTDWKGVPVVIEEVTKDACLRPDVYLDEICERCPFFDRCKLPIRRIKGKVPRNIS